MSEVTVTLQKAKWTCEESLELLKKAHNGDMRAENDLLELIRTKYMPKRIGRYLGRNRQVENDDIRQEFMIGVALAIHKAKLDIGDPVEFILKSGAYRVRSYMRSHILKGTMQVCSVCGYRSRLNRSGNTYICKGCGSNEVVTQEVDDHNELTLEHIQDSPFEDQTLSEAIITGFEATLTPGTNMHSLYELLKSGIDRDNPLVKNYIKEIARMWGGCSEQNVVQHLDKLRNKLRKYLSDNHIEYCSVLS